MVAARILRFLSTGVLRTAMCAPAMLVAAAPCSAGKSASSDVYPVKPIRIIVASSPGTASDFFARSVGEDLGAFYQQRIVIENRSGAGGLIGNTMVSKANADGHTLGMVDVTRIITELMREQPPYRALADIVGVSHVASITNVLAVTPSILARTAPDFVAIARARVGALYFWIARHDPIAERVGLHRHAEEPAYDDDEERDVDRAEERSRVVVVDVPLRVLDPVEAVDRRRQ